MNVDRSWMYDQWHALPRTGLKDEYVRGVDYFIQFACARVLSRNGIRCPCVNCKNRKFQDTITVKLHLIDKGFMPYYQVWTAHGEQLPISPMNVEAATRPCQLATDGHNRGDNPFVDMLFDIAGPSLNIPSDDTMQEDEPNEAAKKFFESLKSAEKPLCPGSEGDTVLSFTSKLFKLKSEHNASQALINGILDLMRPNLPKGHNLPDNYYSAKKLIEALGLPHERIDVCINGCMLFWKDDSELSECKVCRHARWKGRQKTTERKAKNVPYQRLHYLPLIPRLQRLFTSVKTAKYMSWHAERSSEPGKIGHPSDADAWKQFDIEYPEFASESRNVRIGICIDGFNPFGQSGKKFSSWPIMATPYNLPPWMCTKKPYIFLTALVPGPENPKHKIDIYMQPLIDELKQLWNGVQTYDVYKKQNFLMKAAVMWTISDFPAYAMLSGWSTAGKLACPYCMEHADTIYLENSKKVSFFDTHRKFLSANHKYRKNQRNFRRNRIVKAPPPPRLNGHQVWDRVKNLPKRRS